MMRKSIRRHNRKNRTIFELVALASIASLVLQAGLATAILTSFIVPAPQAQAASELLGTCNRVEYIWVDPSYQLQNKTYDNVTEFWCNSGGNNNYPIVFTPNPTPTPSPSTEPSPLSDQLGICGWGEFALVGQSYQWQSRVDYDVTQSWCNAKSVEFHPAVFTPNSTPTPIPTAEPSIEPSPESSPTVSPNPASLIDPTPTPSENPTPSVTPSAEPSISPSPNPAANEPTPAPSTEPTPSVTPTPVPAVSATPIPIVSSAGGGGGGGIVPFDLTITNETRSAINGNSVTITWLTSHFATSSVVYDTVGGKFDQNSAPKYGYSYVKEGDDSGLEKVTGHSVTLTDLVPGTIYYYRTVSIGSLIIGQELSFTVSAIAPIQSQNNISDAGDNSALVSVDDTPIIAAYEPEKLNLVKQPPMPNPEISIVDYLYSIGSASDFDSRVMLAEQNGIVNYAGTADQNVLLLGILKKADNQIDNESIVQVNQEKSAQLASEASDTSNANNSDSDQNLDQQGSTTVSQTTADKNDLQAGLASLTKENSGIRGVLDHLPIKNITYFLFVVAVMVFVGKELWVKILKEEKSG